MAENNEINKLTKEQLKALILIEITGPVQSRDGTYNGNSYTSYSQPAYLHRPSEKYPEKISFSVESANDMLEEGFYKIDFDKSLMVGQWNALGFNRNLTVTPVQV